jgi:hypothetical protein
MKKIILGFFFILACFISSTLFSNSTGAVKRTGAPGEGTCTECHGGTVNSDQLGSASISVAGNPTEYVPGQTYDISITTSYTGRNKFGFALSAKSPSNSDVGTFFKNGNNNVQVVTPQKYVTHTSGGTIATDTKTWTFQWTAPATSVGTVKIYACGLAANNNGDDDPGDKVYSTTLSLPASISAGINDVADGTICSIYPNPATDLLNIHYNVKTSGHTTINLLNITGQLVETLLDESLHAGEYKSQFNLSAKHEKGIYFIQVKSEEGTAIQKIVLL